MRRQHEESVNDASIPTEGPGDSAGSSSRLGQNEQRSSSLREFEDVSSRPRRKLRLTGYRLLCISTLVSFGIAKGVTSYQGKSVISNTLDIAFGVGISAVLLVIGYIYEDRVAVWPWLFKTDYAPKIIHVLRQMMSRRAKTFLLIGPLVVAGVTMLAFVQIVILCAMPTLMAWAQISQWWRHDENEDLDPRISGLLIVLSVADFAAYCVYCFSPLFCSPYTLASKCHHAQSVGMCMHSAIILVSFVMLVLRVLHYYGLGKKIPMEPLPI